MRATGSKQIHSYRLSIRVQADGFSLCTQPIGVRARPESEHVPLEPDTRPSDTLRRALTRLRTASCTYDEVELLVDTPTTWVPLEEFHRNEMHAIYSLTFPRQAAVAEDIRYELLPHLEVTAIYSAPHERVDTGRDIYPEMRLHAIQGQLVQQAAQREQKIRRSGPCMHADQCGEGVFLYAIKDRQLVFASTFPCTAGGDGLYHLLNTWQMLKFDRQTHTCVLHPSFHSIKDKVTQFIKKVELCE